MTIFIQFFIAAFALANSPDGRQAPLSQDLLKLKNSSEFTYKGMGRFYGYGSSKSCLYQNNEVSILVHYCNLDNAPARSLYVISDKWGIIQLYEEGVAHGSRRDILIKTFARELSSFAKKPIGDHTFIELSELAGRISKAYPPACWTTNRTLANERPGANCNQENIQHFQKWVQDSLPIVTNQDEWDIFFAQMSPKKR